MAEQAENRHAADLADALRVWLSGSPGRELVARECACLDEMLADLFGYYLLQVGWTRELDAPIRRSRIRHHLALEAEFPGFGPDTVIGSPHALPVAGDSIDAVLLPHTLDFAADPRQVLREAERVLIPEGRLIVLGFNPWSTWGAWRALRGAEGGVPWSGRFLSPFRLADWLTLLGFDLEMQRPVMFLPPVRQAALLRQFERIEPYASRWFPALASAYALRAVKRVATLTPLQPRWKAKPAVLPGRAVEPTARGRSSV